jgi:tRNA(adenine34) deaminase
MRDTTRESEITLGMAAALDAARRGFESGGELPIGAATVRGGVLTSVRHTEELTQRRRLVHADLLALQDADTPRLSIAERAATTLVITLEPCLLCIGAAMTFGVGHVHFALESPTDGGVRAAEEWSRQVGVLDGFSLPEVSCGLRREESLGLLREFVSSRSSGGLWRWTKDTVASIDAAPDRA